MHLSKAVAHIETGGLRVQISQRGLKNFLFISCETRRKIKNFER
ncbi:MAG: hypothetical protein QXX38_02230 [Candidatus Aenigmatarchaeota archaeon]